MKQTEKKMAAKLPEVREDLLKRLKAAREIRAELVKNNNGGNSGTSVQQLVEMDQENNSWLQSAVEKYGWLGISLVGEDGEDAAFRLVMLAMQSPQLQKQILELLQQAVKNGEAPAAQLALLTERMNTTLGKPSVPAGAVVQSANGMTSQKLNSDTVSSVKYPELREELLKRMAADVQIRTETNQTYKGVPVPAEAKEKMWKIDADNTAWIKPLMKQHGWLGNSLVGVDGAKAAFLMVRHTQDAEFRKSSLELLQKAVKDGEARGDQLALLT